MHLSKLEIKGFKSFGDKAIINFNKGITGVVGPNGCGKSNIVDAIRWVLGEQKIKSLRSDKMENIIFNGTEKRKATQMAEVSLTFDNTKNILPTEYSHIAITRKYYRSGESEYELNGVSCRLKDINNLFLNTGISFNSYAIIELKMVDAILSDTDNSRKGLFEEAAGISKFKKRKKESLKKLENTDIDLERVNDLLFEIEKNLNTLEKQAKQAEKYNTLKNEYKEINLQLASELIKIKKKSFLSLTKKIEDESDKKIVLNKNIAEKGAYIEHIKKILIEKEESLSSQQKALNHHISTIQKYEGDKKIENERLLFLNDSRDALHIQSEQDKKSDERATFSIKDLTTGFNAIKKQVDELELVLSHMSSDKENHRHITQKAEKQKEVFEVAHQAKQTNLYQLSKSLEINKIKTTSLKQQVEKISASNSQKAENLIIFDTRIKSLSEELKEKKEALEAIEKNEKNLLHKIEQNESIISTIKNENAEINRKIDAKKNEYNLTKSLIDNFEGFPEAIKFLKKTPHWSINPPLLFELITCKEEYRVSIENYLETFLNYYVVDEYSDALTAINLLSGASKGKANFFILQALKDYTPSTKIHIKNASHATELVEFDQKYKSLISYILDNVYIINSDNHPLPTNEVIFITQSGKYIKKPLSLSGGSVGLFEGKKIGRTKNLENLALEIKQLKKQLIKKNSELETQQIEWEKLKNSSQKDFFKNETSALSRINEEYVSLTTKREQFASLISHADIDKKDLLSQISTLIFEDEKLAHSHKKIVVDVESSKNSLLKGKEIFESQNLQLAEKSTLYNENNIKFHKLQNKLNSLEQELTFKKTTLEGVRERIKKNENLLKTNSEKIKQLLSRSETNDNDLIKLYEKKEAIEQAVSEAEKKYYASRGNIDASEKEQQHIQRQKENTDTLILELTNSLTDKKFELSSIKERVKIEFQTELDEEVEDINNTNPSTEIPKLEEKILSLKASIEKIGNINPMALEAYNEIKTRYNFIKGQKEDIENAKSSLLTTISEMDTIAKTTFLDAFSKIEKNFIKVFRTLFNKEDQCKLFLKDPSDPLESSIEIIANPKGKKPLTINQLSGGEKTLTAASLLFAIYLLKPAPFCIFDEIDAPLDDANIDKFNKIIREFSSNSQFIIVTHSKRTMLSTDIIYGITMVEQGVSKVVPVDISSLS